MTTPARARVPVRGGVKRATPLETWEAMLAAFRLCDNAPDKYARVAKVVGVHRDTAKKAFLHGVPSAPWGKVPIRDLIVQERANKTAVTTVLAAARVVPTGQPTPEQAALAQVLGQTEFEKVQASVRAAVLEEIGLVDGTRRCAARALRAAEKLADFIDARVDAILKKFGAQASEDGKLTPMEVGNLADEAKLLEVLGRTGHKSATLARLAIEMERLRVGDPDALRRRLDSVYGSELGGQKVPAGPAAAAGEEEDMEDVAAAASPEEVGDIDGWIGLRVIQGGKNSEPEPAVDEEPGADEAEDTPPDSGQEPA